MENHDREPISNDAALGAPRLAQAVPPSGGGGPSIPVPDGARHALLFGRPKLKRGRWWLAGIFGFGIVAALGAWFLLSELDWTAVMAVIERLPAFPLLLAMALLPLVGFPILPVYLVAGARFGPYGGGLVVTVVTAAHLLGTYLLARTLLRRSLGRLIGRWRAQLPEIPPDEQPAVALVAALVPGLPYVVRNYLLALSGLRFRVYFWICLPIYVARSYVSILLGDLGTEPDRRRLIILGVVELVKAGICAGTLAWLRWHHRRVHPSVDPALPRPTA